MISTLIGIFILLSFQAGHPPRLMEFVPVPTGEFMMGCSATDTACRDNEKPPHLVRIARSFRIQKYEVTQDQWRDVMNANPSEYQGDTLPVHNVSWNDIEDAHSDNDPREQQGQGRPKPKTSPRHSRNSDLNTLRKPVSGGVQIQPTMTPVRKSPLLSPGSRGASRSSNAMPSAT